MRLKVVTPIRQILDVENVHSVRVDTPRGALGILPQHAPLFTDLADRCVIQYEQPDGRKSLLVSGGVLHVLFDKITVMTE